MKIESAGRFCLFAAVCWWALGACGKDESIVGTGALERAPTPSVPFRGSSCSSCLATACAAAIDACVQQPECARSWDCLELCPSAPDGSIDSACRAACPQPRSSADAAAALLTCIDTAPCAACGASAGAADAGASPVAPTPRSAEVTQVTPVASGTPTPPAPAPTPAPMAVTPDAGVASPPAAATPAAALLSQSCEPETGEDACSECELNRCCDTRAACQGDESCAARLLCMQSCPGTLPECVASCDASQGTAGFVPLTARVTCLNARCAEECSGAPLSPCFSCVWTNCGELYVACQLDESCARLELCASQCTDIACLAQCRATFPEGVAALDASQLCQFQACGTSC